MIHPIAFIEHGNVLIIEHDDARKLKEKPQQILWINKHAYTIVPIEVVCREVERVRNVDKLQASNCSALYFHSINAIEIPKAISISPSTATTNGRLKDSVPCAIDFTKLEARMQKAFDGIVAAYPKASPTGRFEGGVVSDAKFKLADHIFPESKEDSDFIKHIKMVSKFVETWPKWEQDILGIAKASPYEDKKPFVLPEHRGYVLPKGKRPRGYVLPKQPFLKHKPIKQSKKYIPDKVYLMCKTGALLVGSYARFVLNKADSYNDFDLIVPPDKWYAVSLLINKDVELNSHGGWKFQDDEGHTIDVWPCAIDQHLRQCKPGLSKQEYIVDYINSKVYTSYSIGIKNEA